MNVYFGLNTSILSVETKPLKEFTGFMVQFVVTRRPTRAGCATRRVGPGLDESSRVTDRRHFFYILCFLGFVCFAEIMFRRGQSSSGSQGEFPWLNFPQIESASTMRKWKKKLSDIKKKEVYVPNRIDWEWLQSVRYEEELAPYLLKEFQHEGQTMICDGWSRVFRIQEPVYLELCLEFFSTVSFTGGVDVFHPTSFSFCLGGEFRHCSVVDLAC